MLEEDPVRTVWHLLVHLTFGERDPRVVHLGNETAYFNVLRQKIPYFNVLQQKVPYFNVSRQNRVVFNCFATKHAKDVRSGQPLFCNQPPRGPESEPEIARVTQRESE